MLGFIKSAIKKPLEAYIDYTCRDEFRSQTFTRLNERPIELAFVFKSIAALYPKTILDVGTGTSSLPSLLSYTGAIVTAIDNVGHYWSDRMINRHWHLIDDDIRQTKLTSKFDLITCISVLEHIEEPDLAVKNMFFLLAPGGHLVLTFPYTERQYVRNVYDLPGATFGQGLPYITQSYSRAELTRWLQQNQGEIIEQEFWQLRDGNGWNVGNQLVPPQRVGPDDLHQLSCVLIANR